MATMVPPQKNVEYIFYVGLVSQADTKLLQNNPTLAAGDVLVSTDGGATSNLDTLPAVTPASSDIVKVTVSATEMNGDNIIIVFSDAAGSEWCDLLVNIQTAAQTLDAMDTNIDDIETDTNELQTDWVDGGRLDLLIDAIPTTAMRGTDNAALASVVGALNDAAADGDPTTTETLMQYLKQLINILIGTAGVVAFPAEAAPANAVSLAEVIRAIHADVTGLNGSAMRGTDSVVLAGPTKAEMDTAHALLATVAKQDILDTNVDTLLTRLTATRATYLDYLFSIYFGLVSAVAQAQGGAAGSITLAAAASAVTDFYKGQTVAIYTGTGAGQARAISAYDGSSKEAAVGPDWATAPDATSWYVIMNVGSAIVEDWEDGGRLDLLLDQVITDIGALNDLSAADVNAQVLDVVNTDTIPELSQGIPAATPTLFTAVMLIYMALRDKLESTSTELAIHNDAGTKIAKKTLSDDGTTFSETKMASGA